MQTIIASGSVTLFDQNDAIIAGTQPLSPEINALWIDTSSAPNLLKKYNGTSWDTVSQLDANIVTNIGNIQSTLSNMADDSKLDFKDRQKLKENIAQIIGTVLGNTEALPTVTVLDAATEGSFSRNRREARNAGLLTTEANYVALTNAYNTLRNYLSTHTPKSWDTSVANKDAVIAVAKATFRQHWLNYYNAELALAESTTTFLSSGLNTLKTTTIPALQDKVLSEAEKTAIRSSLMLTQKEKKDIDAIYASYNTNASLVSKTVISTPYTAYTTAYNETITAINNVLAVATGTTIPAALITTVNTKFTNYADKLALLRAALQSAQKTIETKIATDAANNLSTELSNYVTAVDLSKLQDQVDGSITSHFGSIEPSLSNVPAKDWTTTTLKDIHLGDLYYDDVTGYSYRFSKKETVYSWIRITDSDITLALEMANKAQDTADGKRRVFAKTPTPPYDVGDLWAGGGTSDLMKAIVSRATGAYVAADWEKAVKYTDDTAVDNLEIGGRNLLKDSNIGITTSLYLMKAFYLTEKIPEGIEVTVSIKGQLGIGKTSFAIYNSGGNVSMTALSPIRRDEKGVYKYTFNWRVGSSSNTYINVYAMTNAITSDSTIEWIKLEYGNKATDWTPAPEDVSATIESARLAAEAYAKAKTEAETVISKAYADGKVTAEETRAIADTNAKLATAKAYADTESAKVRALTVTAQETANTAKTNAETANNSLADITNDNKLTAGEKSALKIQWDSIVSEFEKNKTQASNQSVNTTAYHNAYTSLTGIIGTSLNDSSLTVTSAVNGASLRAAFKTYYDTRQVLLDGITEALNQKTIDLGTSLDFATSDNKTGILSGEFVYTTKADDAVVHVEVDGKSVQNVGSGKNLFAPTGDWYFNEAKPALISWKKKLKPNTQYTISTSVPTYQVSHNLFFGTYPTDPRTGINSIKPLTSMTITTDSTGLVEVIARGSSDTHGYLKIIDGTYWVQLEEGSTATTYEPPAPSPDYPIAINSLDKSFDIVSSVGGRNLYSEKKRDIQNVGTGGTLDLNNAEAPYGFYIVGTSTDTEDIRMFDVINGNGTYTVSFEARGSQNGAAGLSVDVNKKSETLTSNPNYRKTSTDNSYTTFSIVLNVTDFKGDETDYISWNPTWSYVWVKNIKVEKGINNTPIFTIAPEDNQYNTQTPTIYKTNILLSEPLRSVGDVKDRVYLDSDGLWKVERNIGEESLPSSNGFSTTNTTAYNGALSTNMWLIPKKPMAGNPNKNIERTSHFTHVNQVWDSPNDVDMGGTSLNTESQFHIRVPNRLLGITTEDSSIIRNQSWNNLSASPN